MSAELFGQNPSVGFQSNFLTVDGDLLRADVLKNSRSESVAVSPVELTTILVPARRVILREINATYEQTRIRQPNDTIKKPSIWTAQLGTSAQTDTVNSRVYSKFGYRNGGTHTLRDELQPRFHPHWDAVREAGFLPEARPYSGRPYVGAWLALRQPSLNDVLHHWFGHPLGLSEIMAERLQNSDKTAEQRALNEYRQVGQEVVDRGPNFLRSRQQIGLILSMAALTSMLDRPDQYAKEVDDAFTYMDQDRHMDVSTVRAVENATFESGM